MDDADAVTRVGIPAPGRTVAGGTSKRPATGRQTSTAHGDPSEADGPRLLEQALRRENVLAAYARVVQNAGAPGIDGMTVEDLMPFCREHWARIREDLLSGRYQPAPVRRVEIPKPDGKGTRMLGIPTVLDRFIQQALLQVLTPIFDPGFSDSSFGFRTGRSTHDAIRQARRHMAAGHRWVVDMDLEKFFDRVNHDVLMARVARRVKDTRVLRLIRRFLQAGMMDGGLVSPRTEGTPQGGPLSPLLSNVLLDDLDKELERRGHLFARYADDCNVYVRSQAAGERVLASLERFLWARLRLRVTRDKSAVARPWERRFLGYSVTHHHQPKLRVAAQSVKRLQAKVRRLMSEGRGRGLGSVIEDVNRVTRGWGGYFRFAEVTGTFEDLDKWIRRRLRAIVWRQWKRPWTRYREMCRRGLSDERARQSAFNGRGPWWNAGASHMNAAIPTAVLRAAGLLSLLEEHRRLACAS